MVTGAAVVGGAVVGAAVGVVVGAGAPGVGEVFVGAGVVGAGADVIVLEWVVVAGAWPPAVTTGVLAPFFGATPPLPVTLGPLLPLALEAGGTVVTLEVVTAYAARAASVK